MSELDKVLKALNKKFGEGYATVGMNLLDIEYKRNEFGIFSLDLAIGGGIPERKVMMLAGKPSSGKTTTMLLLIASVQRRGGKVALIDVEHNFDPIYATKLGVDVQKLYYFKSVSIEQVSDTLEPIVRTGELDLVCVDSIAAAPSEKELAESAEKGSYGKAKVTGLLMLKLNARLHDVQTTVKTSVLILNQIREKIGVMYGDPSYTPGGTVLHHLSDIIVWLRAEKEPVGGKENPLGLRVKFKVTKNRTFPPFKAGSYDLLTCQGADNISAAIELGIMYGVIQRTGAWYQYKEQKVKGLDALKALFIDENLVKELKTEVGEAFKNPSPQVTDELEVVVNNFSSEEEE